MTITGPFHTDKPRYGGEHWRVVIKGVAQVANHGFKTREDADAFIATIDNSKDADK